MEERKRLSTKNKEAWKLVFAYLHKKNINQGFFHKNLRLFLMKISRKEKKKNKEGYRLLIDCIKIRLLLQQRRWLINVYVLLTCSKLMKFNYQMDEEKVLNFKKIKYKNCSSKKNFLITNWKIILQLIYNFVIKQNHPNMRLSFSTLRREYKFSQL